MLALRMVVSRIQPILLLEDEADDASFVRHALEKARIKNPLIVYTMAKEARAALANRQLEELPILAIVDIFLPGRESGLDFLVWLREQPHPLGEMPALIYSVSDSSEHVQAARKRGDTLMLRKPVTDATLSQAVQSLGFVVATTASGPSLERVIQPRYASRKDGF